MSSGRFDVALSELGEQQARELGQRYCQQKLDAVFCSDLRRSHDTAWIAFGDCPVPIILDARLTECDYGKFNHHPEQEVKPLKAQHLVEPFPDGESYQEAAERIKSFLKDILSRYDGKKLMIIGHRATQYGLEHWIKDVPLKEAVTAAWQWQPGWTYFLEKIT